MKAHWITRTHLTQAWIPLLATALLVAGCGRQGTAPKPLPLTEIPKAMESAFAKGDKTSREMVLNVVAAIKTNDCTKALWLTESLGQLPSLSSEQHAVIGRSLLTLVEEAQAAAAKGDETTALVMQQRRAMK